MAKIAKKNTHGGARAGAGKKSPATKKSMSFTIDMTLAKRLDRENNKSAAVEAALRLYYSTLGEVVSYGDH